MKPAELIEITHLNIRQSIFLLLFKLLLIDILAAVGFVIFFSTFTIASIPDGLKLTLISNNINYFLLLILAKFILAGDFPCTDASCSVRRSWLLPFQPWL